MHRLERNQDKITSSEINHNNTNTQLITNNEARLSYWQQQLANPNRLNLVTTTNENVINNAKRIKFEINSDDLQKISEFCNEIGVTSKHFFIGALYTLLLQYNQDEDMIIGTTDENESIASSETLPLRIKNAKNATFLHLIKMIARVEKEAIANKLPNLEIFRSIDFPRRAIFKSAAPFQVLLDTKELVLSNEEKPSAFEYFGININNQNCTVEYNSEFFNQHFLYNIMRHFQQILHYAIDHTGDAISSFPVLLEHEIQAIKKYNQTTNNQPSPDLLQSLETIAKSTPKQPLLVFHNKNYSKKSYSYAEINEEANRLAQYLQSLHLPKESYVGICLERSPRTLIAFLAILKAGLAFVPLDTEQNNALTYKLKDPEISCILTDKIHNGFFIKEKRLIVNLDNPETTNNIHDFSTDNLSRNNQADIAYKIYTSGTTGNPKGVVIATKGVNNLFKGLSQGQFPSACHIICTASHCFDACYFDWILAIANKGTIHLTPETHRQNMPFLNRIITNNKINVGVFVPEQLEQIRKDSPLEYIISMGAKANKNLLNALLRARRTRKIWNGYGPTENTIATTINPYHLPEDADYIGQGLNNNYQYCVNPNTSQLTPFDDEGEIWLAGDSLAVKYAGLEEQTKERFCQYHLNWEKGTFEDKPSANAEPIRVYKTGDYGCFSNNNIKFIGRKDRQIKLRGARLELDTIQESIKKQPDIKHSFVVPNESKTNLVAFITLNDGIDKNISDRELRYKIIKHLCTTTSLPLIACPKQVIRLDEMPLNTNGKLDVQKLLKNESFISPPTRKFINDVKFTPLQEILLPFWLNSLKLTKKEFQQKDPDDCFIELGGCSLELTNLRTEILENRENLQIDPKYTDDEIIDMIQPFLSFDMLAQTLEKALITTNEIKKTEKNKSYFDNFGMFPKETERENKDKMQSEQLPNSFETKNVSKL